uniref:Uncharacterized protein n=1 Tax=Strombidinopsis acuminata TaxID=141414 RepID=A0A7S3U712_9SPIT|mmetsp:Transcript_9228/g.12231  ORF Transcript_9228/g.12231 Transcript_9228/m.12231 type:complete len:157 (+) Transcript_9228:946-1416(+)
MIEQLRKEIILVYQDSKGQDTKGDRDRDQVKAKAVDVQTKGSLDMLMEIELISDTQMRLIKQFEKTNSATVNYLERQAKLTRAKEKRDKMVEDNARKERDKKKAAAARNQREIKVFGKKQMWRSNKKMVRKKVFKVERDQDQEDRLKYLGDIGETE